MEEQAKKQETKKTEVKQETIMDTANTKDTRKKKEKNSKLRMILVIIFLLVFALISYVQLRGSYLEYIELGTQYTNIFYTNIFYKYGIMAVNFVFLYIVIYFTNRGIRPKLTALRNLSSNLFTAIISLICALLLEITTTANTFIIIGCLTTIFAILLLDYMRDRVGLKPSKYSKEDLKYSLYRPDLEKKKKP